VGQFHVGILYRDFAVRIQHSDGVGAVSASEKLKANPPYVESEAGPLIPDPRWPQIVAVVEAAEETTAEIQLHGMVTDHAGGLRLRYALAALEEALS
jgi:hypothetical protein